MNLNKDIAEAIEKNLPSLVATQLKDYIRQAEEDKKAIITMQEKDSNKQKELERTQIELSKAVNHGAKLECELAEFKVRENDIKGAEKRINDANWKMYSAEHALDEVKSVIAMVFKTPVVRRQVIETGMAPAGVGQQNGYPMAVCSSTNNTTTETTEEE